MRVAIVHYHFRRGGVTSVVANAVRALEPKGVECVAFCGEPSKVPMPCPLRVVEGLGYRADLSDGGPDAETLFHDLVTAAKEAFGGNEPDVWHIHNHSLGKNVHFAALVNRLAQSGRHLLLQIHDFSEDGRSVNFRVAHASAGSTLYPHGKNVAYSVLNARDAAILKRAGACPHILPNAVPSPQQTRDYDPEKALPQFEELYLYPTRGIRRKNIGETVLYAALAPKGAGVATTLAPENPQWLPVHRQWEHFAAAHGLPLILGTSGQGADFGSLCQRATAWLTTSVAEGFGLAYLEPWGMDKALIGRDLPDITADFLAEGLSLSHLYTRLPIPVDCIETEAFRARLSGALMRNYGAYGCPFAASMVDKALASWIVDGGIDFGVLDEAAQQEALKTLLGSPQLRAELAPLLYKMPSSDTLAQNKAVASGVYGLEAYAERLFYLYENLLADVDCGVSSPHSVDESEVLKAFLKPESFRMLRSQG